MSTQWNIVLEALGMRYFFKKLMRYFLTHPAILHAAIPFCYWGLKILALSSRNFWAFATSLHLGWHAHPGKGSSGNSNHTTTIPETYADCLKIVHGLTESMGEAGRCAAHKAPASQVPAATKTSRCAAHKAPASQAPVATKQTNAAEE